jgi:hypothetical protein
MLVGVQHAETAAVLNAVPSDGDPLVVTIPENALYYVVIEDTSGQGGDYTAAFEASPRVSFALESHYTMIGRLPEGGLLYYTYTGPGGDTLQGNVIPHPDTPLDLLVTIRELESQEALQAFNATGAGENETFTFTVPGSDDEPLTYIVSIEDAGRRRGAYLLAVDTDAPEGQAGPAQGPEDVLQAVFDAARSGDFSGLADLCDPLGENDGDTRIICELATDETNREDFVAYFASGSIADQPQISPDGTRATVPFLFGPDGDQKETMELIKRDGQWYLLGF